jgi:dCTP deaminase
MAILSDTDIKDRIGKKELVTGGDAARAEHCSYSFLPGRIFHAGKPEAPIDFTSATADLEVLVGPGEMIWVRTLEEVKLPPDLVGFWWQTNTLSKKGLMLVNMSMVEPGYEGPLACLFVNFGKDRIPINPQTKIAKMVFTELSSPVTTPFDMRFDLKRYDQDLRELALGHPNTFLQVADLVAGLKDERTRAISDIQIEGQKVKSSAESELASLKTSAEAELASLRTAALKEFQADTWKSARNSFAAAALAVAIITAVLSGYGWLKGELTPDVNAAARAEVEKALGQRVVVRAPPDAEADTRMVRKMQELDRRLSQVERRR